MATYSFFMYQSQLYIIVEWMNVFCIVESYSTEYKQVWVNQTEKEGSCY